MHKQCTKQHIQCCVLRVLLWRAPCLSLRNSALLEGPCVLTAAHVLVRDHANQTPLCTAGKDGPIDLCSWAQEYPALREAANNISFWDKKGQVIWRGRHEENSWRDHVR